MHKNITLNNTYSDYDLILVPCLKARIFELQESFTLSRNITDKRLIDNDINYLQELLNNTAYQQDCLNRLQTIFDQS